MAGERSYFPAVAAKQDAGLYDPGQQSPLQKEYAQATQEHEALMDQLRKTAYKTISVNINGKETEIPVWKKGITNEQAESDARDRLEMGLHPFAPESQLIQAQREQAGHPPISQNTATPTPLRANQPSYFPAANGIISSPHEDQGQSMVNQQMTQFLTPIDLAHRYYAQQLQNEINRQRAMNEISSSNPPGSDLTYRPNATPPPVVATTPVPQSYFPAASIGISSRPNHAFQNIPNWSLNESGRFGTVPYMGSPPNLTLPIQEIPHETRYFRQYSIDQLATPPRNLYDKTPSVLGSYESYRL